MQNQNQAENFLNWKPASKFIQFAFEQGGHRPFSREDEDEENLENGSPRKTSKHQEQEQDDMEISYEPSNQVVDFQKTGDQNQVLEVSNSGKVVVDEVNRTSVFISKAFLPTITVNCKLAQKPTVDGQGISEKSKYIELFLAQKSHSSQYQKYKIIKGGLKGLTRHKIRKQPNIKFQKIKFNYFSIPEKLPRLILVVYQQKENKRSYKSVMISDQFSIIDNHKILAIQSAEALKLYFQSVSPTFLDKTGTVLNQKINISNKHKIIQEMGTFQNYLIKKNKKIWNIVYAAYKYAHIADLYFYNPQNKPKKQQFLQLWKQVIDSFRSQQTPQNQKTCNHLHPTAKFVLKINFPMRTVRFIINKEYTKYLSIIATEHQFQTANKWVKFDDTVQMKQVFIVCYNEIQAKLISEPLITKTSAMNNSSQQQVSPPIHGDKKGNHHQKNEDEDFNQQDIEDQDDDVEYQGESSENYSMSNRKRGRKAGQKKSQDLKKLGNGAYNRQNKYTTRGGNRTKNKQDTEDSNDKKANMLKKNKQKQMLGRPPVQGNPVTNPPFRVLTPTQAGQYKDQQTQAMDPNKMIGIIPMNMNQPSLMGMKKQDGNKPKPMGIPMMMPGGMNPQMMAMMSGGQLPQGMQMMPMGNGMQAIMMPVQMDKGQGTQQPTMGAMQIPGMGAMGMAGMPGMTAMSGMPGMGGMMPMMMGGAGGMPQGFMMPTSMLAAQQAAQNQKNKSDAQKQKHSDKKEQKKQSNTQSGFPPQAMQAVDLSKMGIMGQMPAGMQMMPNGQLGMSMPQLMQIGMPGLSAASMMGGASGMPQGIMMNPMMQMQKQATQNKQQNTSKQNPSTMQNPLFGGQMPFMMAQMPSQLQSQNQTATSQNQNSSIPNMPNITGMPNIPGMQLGMMGGQFPQMMQMGQANPQMQGNPHGQQGMPMGYMMLNQQQLRQLTPQQQMQIQMQMLMNKGMMPGMMQMPKNDGGDQNKK